MSPNKNEKALVIMRSGKRRSQLCACLKVLGITAVEVGDCQQARRALARRQAPKLVISDTEFPDGDWRDALAATQQRPGGLSFLLSTPYEDHGLWADALWRGAYDLLVEPYSASELRRIIEGALRAHLPHGARPREAAAVA